MAAVTTTEPVTNGGCFVDAHETLNFHEVEPPSDPSFVCQTQFFQPPLIENAAVMPAPPSMATASAIAQPAEEHKEGLLARALHGVEHLLHLDRREQHYEDHHEDHKSAVQAEAIENSGPGGGAVSSDSPPNAHVSASIGSLETETELRALVLRTEARAERRERENDEALQHFAERLRGLSSEVHAVERRQVKLDQHLTELDTYVQSVAESIDNERLAFLEQSQKKVMISARRSLEMVVAMQSRQQSWEFEQEGKLAFYMNPPAPGTERSIGGSAGASARDLYKSTKWNAVLDLQWANRLTEQEQKMSSLTSEVAALTAALGFQAANAKRSLGLASEPVGRKARSLSPTGPMSTHGGGAGGTGESWDMVAMQSLEAWMENGLKEANRRVDALQEQVDERVLMPLWQVSQDMPEMVGRVDRLTAQCQGHAANIGKHEVRLNLLSERLESCGAPVAAGTSSSGGQSVVVGDSGQLAGRVDAHSMALGEIREQLKLHSDVLGASMVEAGVSALPGMSRSSSRGSLAARQLNAGGGR